MAAKVLSVDPHPPNERRSAHGKPRKTEEIDAVMLGYAVSMVWPTVFMESIDFQPVKILLKACCPYDGGNAFCCQINRQCRVCHAVRFWADNLGFFFQR